MTKLQKELPKVGRWAEEKYKLLKCYIDIFSTGMKNKWPQRVYIDLFAGAGSAIIRDSNTIVDTSSVIALNVKNPFNKYIFCEKDNKNYTLLKKRVKRDFSQSNFKIINGDCNEVIDEIIGEIPSDSNVLTFCFVDPFGLHIKFDTIRKLSQGRRIDFLILLALSMDAVRNKKLYIREDNDTLDNFLGGKSWRAKKAAIKNMNRNDFRRFLINEYSNNMYQIGYKKPSFGNTKEIKASDNLPLYHLAFYSKSDRGYDFWREAKKYSTNQLSIEFPNGL